MLRTEGITLSNAASGLFEEGIDYFEIPEFVLDSHAATISGEPKES